MPKIPRISVGLPVYNGEETLRGALDSILGQTVQDIEVIISDNASTDDTQLICNEYVARDNRVKYFRQPQNIGPWPNFQFVLNAASAGYFMWSAADDRRSRDFLELTLGVLETDRDAIAATCPNCYEGQDPAGDDLIVFSLVGPPEKRFIEFFDMCWKSHGIFYSLIRTHALRSFRDFDREFLAADWSINLHLLSQGTIQRTGEGLLTLGVNGMSSNSSAWSNFRKGMLGWILPLKEVSSTAWKLSKEFRFGDRLVLLWILIKLNSYAAREQMICELYLNYKSVTRNWIDQRERDKL